MRIRRVMISRRRLPRKATVLDRALRRPRALCHSVPKAASRMQVEEEPKKFWPNAGVNKSYPYRPCNVFFTDKRRHVKTYSRHMLITIFAWSVDTFKKFKTFGKFLTKYIIGEPVWVDGKQIILSGGSQIRISTSRKFKPFGKFFDNNKSCG